MIKKKLYKLTKLQQVKQNTIGKRFKTIKWVVGVRSKEEHRIAVKIAEKRDKETLLNFVQEFVEPGTMIYSDEWKGYADLRVSGHNHETVSHKKEFAKYSNEMKIEINFMEALWSSLRKFMRFHSYNRKNSCRNILMNGLPDLT